MSIIETITKTIKSDAFPRIIPFAIFMLIMIIESAVKKAEISGIDLRWVDAVSLIIVSGILLVYWSKYSELKKVDSNRGIDWLITIVIGIGIFVIWINLDQAWATMTEIDPEAKYNPYAADGKSFDWILLSIRMAESALVVPLMEELFFRSFLMRWIEKSDFLSVPAAQVSMRAIVIMAVIFMLEHNLWLAGLIAGLAYGWLYWRTGNLWMCICAHAITNAVLGVWIIKTGQWQFW